MLDNDISLELNLVVIDLDFALLKNCNLIKRYFRSEFILKAVYLNELSVQFLFIRMKFVEIASPLAYVTSIAVLYKSAIGADLIVTEYFLYLGYAVVTKEKHNTSRRKLQ